MAIGREFRASIFAFVAFVALLAACEKKSAEKLSPAASDEVTSNGGGTVPASQISNGGTVQYSQTGNNTSEAADQLSGRVTGTTQLNDFESRLAETLCKDTVKNRLTGTVGGFKWKSLNQWRKRLAPSQDGSDIFVSPTNIVGIWLKVQFFANKEAAIEVQTPSMSALYEFTTLPNDRKQLDCSRLTKKLKPFKISSEEKAKRFTDRDLRQLIKTNKIGIVYLWSPKMGYSFSREKGVRFNGIDNIQEAASRLSDLGSVKVSYAVEPTSNDAKALRRWLAQKRPGKPVSEDMLKPVHSIEVFNRSMNHHYPSILVYANGRIAEAMLPGVETVEGYEKFIREQIAKIKTDLSKTEN